MSRESTHTGRVAPLGVPPTFFVGGVTEPARHLDDQPLSLVEEVDPRDLTAVSLDPPPCDRAWQPVFANEMQEPALEHRFSAAVDEQPVEEPHAAPVAHGGQPCLEHKDGREAQADRTVDR
jgi:hypothetical protein